MKTAITTPDAPAAVGPYSQAIEAGDFLFLSGQIPLKEDGTLVNGTIEEQTHQVMKNLKAVLNAAGLDFSDVVKTEIFLIDLENFAKVNEVYASYLKAPFPARATIGVKALPKGAQIEIAMIAMRSYV